jgi:hypothetical protein
LEMMGLSAEGLICWGLSSEGLRGPGHQRSGVC